MTPNCKVLKPSYSLAHGVVAVMDDQGNIAFREAGAIRQ